MPLGYLFILTNCQLEGRLVVFVITVHSRLVKVRVLHHFYFSLILILICKVRGLALCTF